MIDARSRSTFAFALALALLVACSGDADSVTAADGATGDAPVPVFQPVAPPPVDALTPPPELLGQWEVVLSPEEEELVELARQRLRTEPDNAAARTVSELMEQVATTTLTVDGRKMSMSVDGQVEEVAYAITVINGGRLAVTTTDVNGSLDEITIELDGRKRMTWTSPSEDRAMTWKKM
jgi:hypothetical protein